MIKPTLTDKVLAKNLLAGATRYEAMQAAGFSKSMSVKKTTRCDSEGVRTALAEALEKAGGTKDEVARVLVAGLSAVKVISAVVIASDGEGMKDAGSMTKDFVEVTDFQERRKAAESISELAGWKPKGQLEVSQGETYPERIARLQRRSQGIIDEAPEDDESVIESDVEPVDEKTDAQDAQGSV